jgi:hypothetical protein
MTSYMVYLLEASICLALFYFTYWLLIKGDTFHHLKRVYLLLSVVLSLIIPELPSSDLSGPIKKAILPVGTGAIQHAQSVQLFTH